jgi:hypothetical protein
MSSLNEVDGNSGALFGFVKRVPSLLREPGRKTSCVEEVLHRLVEHLCLLLPTSIVVLAVVVSADVALRALTLVGYVQISFPTPSVLVADILLLQDARRNRIAATGAKDLLPKFLPLCEKTLRGVIPTNSAMKALSSFH